MLHLLSQFSRTVTFVTLCYENLINVNFLIISMSEPRFTVELTDGANVGTEDRNGYGGVTPNGGSDFPKNKSISDDRNFMKEKGRVNTKSKYM